ncbi:MAG: hypothetical protein IPJ56_02600 [Gemmatimonadetes bacterium]|nr:hypothetical protein [Gemmatimonadota bacterium]
MIRIRTHCARKLIVNVPLNLMALSTALTIGCSAVPNQRIITVLVDASLSNCATSADARHSGARDQRLQELARERRETWTSIVNQLHDGDSVTVYLAEDDQLQRRTVLQAFQFRAPSNLTALQASQLRARQLARLRTVSIDPPACHGDSPLLAAVLLAATPNADGRRPDHIVLVSDLVEDSRIGGRRLRFDAQAPPPRDSMEALLSALSPDAHPLEGTTLHLISMKDLRPANGRLVDDRIAAIRRFWLDFGKLAGARVVLGDTRVDLGHGASSRQEDVR